MKPAEDNELVSEYRVYKVRGKYYVKFFHPDGWVIKTNVSSIGKEVDRKPGKSFKWIFIEPTKFFFKEKDVHKIVNNFLEGKIPDKKKEPERWDSPIAVRSV